MTDVDLVQILDYNYWARDRVLAAVVPLTEEQYTRALPSSFGSIRDTLVHVYGAEWVWYQRWTGVSPAALPRPDSLPGVAQLREAWVSVESAVRDALRRLGPGAGDQICEYRTLSGAADRQTFGEIVQHVVNHGSYHRGQISTLLRQVGAAPPRSMDLITYFRERRREPRESGGETAHLRR